MRAHERRYSQKSEGLEFCGTEVSGSCEPLDVGAGTETWVLWKKLDLFLTSELFL